MERTNSRGRIPQQTRQLARCKHSGTGDAVTASHRRQQSGNAYPSPYESHHARQSLRAAIGTIMNQHFTVKVVCYAICVPRHLYKSQCRKCGGNPSVVKIFCMQIPGDFVRAKCLPQIRRRHIIGHSSSTCSDVRRRQFVIA